MDNKEVSKLLQEYFLKQDPKLIARACANFILDLNRFINFKNISVEERSSLVERTKLNMKEVYNFLKAEGSEELLNLINWNEKD